MAEQRYRFGGPIPESVQRLKSRREYRASSLYAGVKKSRRERFAAATSSSLLPSAEQQAAVAVLTPFLHGAGLPASSDEANDSKSAKYFEALAAAVRKWDDLGMTEGRSTDAEVTVSGAASLVKDLTLADGANHTVVDSHDGAAAKNDGFPSDEAGLADVVSSLIDAWCSGPGLAMGGIAAQRKFSTGELDQRVLAALIEGCLQFQIFFLQLGQIRLELQKSGVVSEQSLLSLEKLVHQGCGPFVDEGRVAQGAHSFGDVSRGSD